MGVFADTLMAGALPCNAFYAVIKKVYISGPVLVIGVTILVIGIVLYIRRPAEI